MGVTTHEVGVGVTTPRTCRTKLSPHTRQPPTPLLACQERSCHAARQTHQPASHRPHPHPRPGWYVSFFAAAFVGYQLRCAPSRPTPHAFPLAPPPRTPIRTPPSHTPV